jgi:aspartate kinase
MKVFKFGGASVKDARAVLNVVSVLDRYKGEPVLVVVSAMGKSTNALEKILQLWFDNGSYYSELNELFEFHRNIIGGINELLQTTIDSSSFDNYCTELVSLLADKPQFTFDQHYDALVSYGELLSTAIVSAALQASHKDAVLFDVRQCVKTNNRFRSATVNWEKSAAAFHRLSTQIGLHAIVITQGFIGESDEGFTTTLGREGSDYSAAILAYLADANSVTIWKDVPGMLNADPRLFPDAVMLPKISYREAIELSYYGASVIHPKTIQPLQNKGIPLYVKSFLNPENSGSAIQQDDSADKDVPSFIIKQNQVLVSVTTRDFSFIVEEHLSEIFDALAKCGIKINVMQNSAISFSFCIDEDERKFNQFREILKPTYSLRFNSGMSLLTIRHYNDEVIGKLIKGREILLEQRSRTTLRVVMR